MKRIRQGSTLLERAKPSIVRVVLHDKRGTVSYFIDSRKDLKKIKNQEVFKIGKRAYIFVKDHIEMHNGQRLLHYNVECALPYSFEANGDETTVEYASSKKLYGVLDWNFLDSILSEMKSSIFTLMVLGAFIGGIILGWFLGSAGG